MTSKSNHNSTLTISSDPEDHTLQFELPGLKIGTASYQEGPTGCTVFRFDKPSRAAVDIRGGSAGVLVVGQWDMGEEMVDAICLTAGSIYGIEALSGVYSEIFAARNFSTHWEDLPAVMGAVIYDYRPRDNSIYPDKTLGAAAFRNSKEGIFPLGRKGVGTSATVGKLAGNNTWEFAGQGGAYVQIGETKIAVFTVVNALGAIVDRNSKIVRGNLERASGERIDLRTSIISKKNKANLVHGNTTLSVLVTNQSLKPSSLRQLGKAVHSSMARAIQPFHLMGDGDVFFTVTTDEISSGLNDEEMGIVASEVAWDAVLSSFTI